MAKKEIKEKIEREYTIPLREKCRPVPRYKKTPKAVKTIKEFLVKHMQIRDRDLKKIKIDQYLNEQIWMQGIRSPVHKIKVKVIKQGDIVRVYAVNLPKKIEFKKIRLEKQDQKAKDAKEKKKGLMQKAKESMQAQPKEEKEEQDPEKKQEEKEKVKAVAEAGKQMEKEAAKQAKHQASAKTKEPKRPVRKVMNK